MIDHIGIHITDVGSSAVYRPALSVFGHNASSDGDSFVRGGGLAAFVTDPGGNDIEAVRYEETR